LGVFSLCLLYMYIMILFSFTFDSFYVFTKFLSINISP
jgi:hypothetical protein